MTQQVDISRIGVNIQMTNNFFKILPFLFVSGCSTPNYSDIFESKDSSSMESILRGGSYSDVPIVRSERSDLRSRHDSTNNQIKELSNPTIIVHFSPHMTNARTPIQQLKVPIKMYDKVHFALPGEL